MSERKTVNVRHLYTADIQRKMLQLSTGALLLLLPWFGGLVFGEISNDFSQCLDFFYNKTPPKGISAAGYQPICQQYNNQYRFASLYHRQHRAPLYSAYILSPADGKRPISSWMYEPQVRVLCTVGVTGKRNVSWQESSKAKLFLWFSKIMHFFYQDVIVELSESK